MIFHTSVSTQFKAIHVGSSLPSAQQRGFRVAVRAAISLKSVVIVPAATAPKAQVKNSPWAFAARGMLIKTAAAAVDR